MTLDALIARGSRGWRGPVLAALFALLAGLPGALAIPPLDRDESRFAQATAQMLETRDFVMIRFQDQPRFKKPVGIHWLQAASVAVASNAEARAIWAYRLPSLLGAMTAAAACAWGAAAFFGAEAGLLAGVLLAASLLLSTEAMIAKTDAVLCGAITLAMAALAQVYLAARGGPAAPRRAVWLFWIALAVSVLVKGPIGPMVAALTLVALTLADRRPGWLVGLRWWWGLIIIAAIVGPWAGAITVRTDGSFWTTAIGGDLAPKLAGGQESHGAPPGYHTLLAPLLAFPMTLLLPAAAVAAWRRRGEPGVRFALAWLLPSWAVFEAMPTKLAHYPLPLYPALAWLVAAGIASAPVGRSARWVGAVLATLIGLVLAWAPFALAARYGDASDWPFAALAALPFAAAGLGGAWLLLRDRTHAAIAVAAACAVLGHGLLLAGLGPRLLPLWVSSRAEAAMGRARLLPRQGIAEAPVAVTGYSEPSLIFALGTGTELDSPQEAAQAIAESRPAIVESRKDAAFRKALAEIGAKARAVARVSGLDYSNGQKTTLTIYRTTALEPPDPSPEDALP
jgi:4-amino-4-deoxy-L-arabinose transferase-like glycosyltransferase